MEFYQLGYLPKGPVSPKRWSYSALASWRACPRRWWLERSEFDNAPKPYPRRTSAAAIRGRLVHAMCEQFAEHIADSHPDTEYAPARASFPVRSLLTEELRQLRVDELDSNPRINVDRLFARLSLDECVNLFRRVAPSVWEAARRRPGVTDIRSDRNTLHAPVSGASGAEVWLESSDLPIAGRIDVVQGGVITDFKTGEPSGEHWDQLRFYALLAAGARVEVNELRLIYAEDGRMEARPAPTEHEIELLRRQLAEEIDDIEGSLKDGLPPKARPNGETCRYCAVRQHCAEYWSTGITSCLRLSETSFASDDAPVALWLDVEAWLIDRISFGARGYTGRAQVSSTSQCMARIDVPRFRPIAEVNQHVRILGARVSIDSGGVWFECVPDTEVFWFVDVG